MRDVLSDCGIGEAMKRPVHVAGNLERRISRSSHVCQPIQKFDLRMMPDVGSLWFASVNFKSGL